MERGGEGGGVKDWCARMAVQVSTTGSRDDRKFLQVPKSLATDHLQCDDNNLICLMVYILKLRMQEAPDMK